MPTREVPIRRVSCPPPDILDDGYFSNLLRSVGDRIYYEPPSDVYTPWRAFNFSGDVPEPKEVAVDTSSMTNAELIVHLTKEKDSISSYVWEAFRYPDKITVLCTDPVEGITKSADIIDYNIYGNVKVVVNNTITSLEEWMEEAQGF